MNQTRSIQSMHQQTDKDETKTNVMPKLLRPDDWADSIGSLSMISALIFGFSAAVITNVHEPEDLDGQKEIYFASFVTLLGLAVGLSFIGLAVTSIMYHNVKGFQAYGLTEKGLKDYERKSYVIKNFGYYNIYISWAALVVAIMLYTWVYFHTYIAIIATTLTTIMLIAGILMGAHLANMYAKYSGDQHILHVFNPEHIDDVMHRESASVAPVMSTLGQMKQSNSN